MMTRKGLTVLAIGASAVLAFMVWCFPRPRPQMSNMQPLGSYYSAEKGELMLALLSKTAAFDPQKRSNRDSIHVKLRSVEGEEFVVEHKHLKINVPGDYVRPEHRTTLVRFSLVIDESGSINAPDLQAVRDTIRAFFEKLPQNYEAQIIRFANQIQISPFSTQPGELLQHLQGPQFGGGTALYDAIDQSLVELRQSKDDVALKFCVAFTDGHNNASVRFSTTDALVQRVGSFTRQSLTPLFLAGIGENVDSYALKTIADRSLGFYMHLKDVRQLNELFDFVLAALKNTYVIHIPISSKFLDLDTVYILREKSQEYGSFETIQDVPIKRNLRH